MNPAKLLRSARGVKGSVLDASGRIKSLQHFCNKAGKSIAVNSTTLIHAGHKLFQDSVCQGRSVAYGRFSVPKAIEY